MLHEIINNLSSFCLLYHPWCMASMLMVSLSSKLAPGVLNIIYKFKARRRRRMGRADGLPATE